MNDYLSNLFARSFDRTGGIPLVSPRVPSLFEPSHEVWNGSVEIPPRPSMNDQPNDETPPPSLARVGEEPKGLETPPKRYSQMDSGAPTLSGDVSRLYRGSMEISPGNAERSVGDYEPAVTALPRQDLPTVTAPQTSAKLSDNRLLEPHVRNDKQQEPATRKTKVTAAELPVQLPGGKGSTLSVQGRREERSTQPQSKSRKERVMVENVIVKERVERIFDRDVSSRAEVGEHHNVIMPSMMQQPLHHPVEPICNPWRNAGHREAPTKTEPTIQVTIGRIEVRAVMHQTSKPQQREAPKPKLSLDDYLRQRTEGKR
jgi:hypothetical protein